MIEREALAELKGAQPPWRMQGQSILGTGTNVFQQDAASTIGVTRAFDDSHVPQVVQDTMPNLSLAQNPAPGGSGSEGAAGVPFQFQATVNAANGTVTINANSFCLQSYTDGDFLTITGLGSALTLASTDKIWLKVPVTSSSFPFTFGTGVIESLGNGNAFVTTIQNDGGSGSPTVYSQTFFRVVLATVSAGVVTQCVSNQLRIDQVIYLPSLDSSGGSAQTILAAFAYPTG